MLDIFIGEYLGTMVLILLGNGVVANVVYKKTKGSGSGLIVIAVGWALAVYMGVQVANSWQTGAHINPAVSVAMLTKGTIAIDAFFVYVGAQMVGAITGQLIVNTVYWQHVKENETGMVLATHSTGPTHKDAHVTNFVSEFVGTCVLVGLVVLTSRYFANDLGAMGQFVGPLSVAMVVFGIGVSLGGTTGYAINPARDLGPRIVYALTFRKKEDDADWQYSWIPVVAPLLAGVVIALIF